MNKVNRWHIEHLDSLRGIAVLGVVMVHSWSWFGGQLSLPWRMMEVAMSGQRGVQLFFIVSAFTLFLSHDNRRTEHRPTVNFFIRRFFRLAPMFYIAAGLSYLFLRPWFGPRRYVVMSLLFVNGFSPWAIGYGPVGGWSVADEAIFYLCLPFLFRFIRNLRATLIVLSIAIPVLVVASRRIAVAHPSIAGFATFSGFPVEFPVFLMGIAGYFIWKKHLSRFSGERDLSLSLLMLAVVLYFSLMPFHDAGLYATSAVCLLLLISLSLHRWHLFVNRFTKFLGKISYSVYLLHFCVLRGIELVLRVAAEHHAFFSRPVVEFWVCFIAGLGITVPSAYLTWRWVEEPGIHLGKWLIVRLERERTLVATP
jgi:peptidoglycan/LPS O-acetylase OafA/YrhL